MNNSSPTVLPTLAERLCQTLEQESQAMGLLTERLRGMLQAIRSADSAGLAEGASSLQGQIHAATELRLAQRRQVSLFCRTARLEEETLDRVLAELAAHPDAREVRSRLHSIVSGVRAMAVEAGQLVAALEFSIRFASQVNQEMVQMLHGLMQPDGGRVYTAKGTTTAPKNRKSLLNRVG